MHGAMYGSNAPKTQTPFWPTPFANRLELRPMAFVVEIDFGFGHDAPDFKSCVNKAGALAHIRKVEDYRSCKLYEVIGNDDPREAIAQARRRRATARPRSLVFASAFLIS